jgi:hypothetical protein
MPPLIRTIYSNVVAIEISDTELILKFGAQFNDAQPAEANQFVPEVRIVLPKNGADHLINAIRAAIESDKKKAPSKKDSRASG